MEEDWRGAEDRHNGEKRKPKKGKGLFFWGEKMCSDGGGKGLQYENKR